MDKDIEEGSSRSNLAGSGKRRGKERARDVDVLDTGDDAQGDEEEDEGGVAGYPPTKEQEDESRRVEEVCLFFLSFLFLNPNMLNVKTFVRSFIERLELASLGT